MDADYFAACTFVEMPVAATLGKRWLLGLRYGTDSNKIKGTHDFMCD
jgi:hypothetical protein